MPIEIRELIIRAEVGGTAQPTQANNEGQDNLQKMVDKVLEAINNQQER